MICSNSERDGGEERISQEAKTFVFSCGGLSYG